MIMNSTKFGNLKKKKETPPLIKLTVLSLLPPAPLKEVVHVALLCSQKCYTKLKKIHKQLKTNKNPNIPK